MLLGWFPEVLGSHHQLLRKADTNVQNVLLDQKPQYAAAAQ